MSNKKLPENATKTEGAELARRGRGEISTATAVPHVSYDDLRHADRITVEGREVFANHGVYPEENALGQKFIVSLVLYADLRAAGEHDTWTPRLTTARYATMSMAICASTFKLIEAAARAWPRCCCVVTPAAWRAC
ncbi:MAG: dihydroneopterin aldolase [Collinsella sp.]